MAVTDLHYYSNDYANARKRFCETLDRLQGTLPGMTSRAFQVPSGRADGRADHRDSHRDDDLFVDYAYIPPSKRKKTLFVLISGVHGIECFTGSAIQLMLLNEFTEQLASAETGFFIAHAMNPFGFKHLRRSTEGNINLNRNFAPNREMFFTENPGYRKLHDFLAPDYKVIDPHLSFLTNTAKAMAIRHSGEFTTAEFIQSVAQGQFEYPRGLEYGGTRPEPQIADFLEQLKAVSGDYQEIICFDLHTGLGERYELHLIPGNAKKPADQEFMKQLFRFESDQAIYAFTEATAEGFYQTVGDSNELIMQLLTPQQRGVSMTLEYGTIGNSGFAKLVSLSRLITENQGYHYGYLTEMGRKRAEREMIEVFAPREDRWRINTIERARLLLTRVFARL